MRPLKFRAWDKLSRTMRTGTVLEMAVAFDNPDFEIMQFTGLLDRHKKEIYEGDVVKITDEYAVLLPVDAVCIVQWSTDGVAFVLESVDRKSLSPLERIEWHRNHTFEILGNIYEYPHLLEATHDP